MEDERRDGCGDEWEGRVWRRVRRRWGGRAWRRVRGRVGAGVEAGEGTGEGAGVEAGERTGEGTDAKNGIIAVDGRWYYSQLDLFVYLFKYFIFIYMHYNEIRYKSSLEMQGTLLNNK